MPHDHGERLDALMDTIRAGWRKLLSGGAWSRDKQRYGIGGSIRAWDCTFGVNGAHPHLHSVILCERTLTATELVELESRLHGRWASAIVARGHRAPTVENGTRLEVARSPADIAKYISKLSGEDTRPTRIAMEVARADLKQGRHDSRTPWQVLGSFVTGGDCADLAIWHEWEQATKGRQFMRYSAGLRALVGLAPEKSDEEIAAEEVGGEEVYAFSPEEWHAVCATRGAQAHVLELAEMDEGGTEAIRLYVRSLLQRWQMHRHVTAAPEMVH
jgi:hypothetical protein